MKKFLITLIVAFVSSAIAQMTPGQRYVIFSMVTAATDLTNLSKSDYGIFLNLENDGITKTIFENEGKNLCERERFATAVGSVVCSHEVKYHKADQETADIIITDKEIAVERKAIVTCTKDLKDCDLVIKDKGFQKNDDNLKKKGFVPDPTLKQRRTSSKNK